MLLTFLQVNFILALFLASSSPFTFLSVSMQIFLLKFNSVKFNTESEQALLIFQFKKFINE